MHAHHRDPVARAKAVEPNAMPRMVTDDPLAPLLAGAYARGMAETLDLFGIAGVFLDRSGEVLHVTKATDKLLSGPLRLHMRHMLAERNGDNKLLAAFIADAVGNDGVGNDGVGVIRLPEAAIELRCLPRSAGFAMPGQMVAAVVAMARETDPGPLALLRLLTPDT